MTYPSVIGEFDTVRKLLDGFSIGRFGDGEFKMAYGVGYRRQDPSPVIASELQGVLNNPKPQCLVGIPTMDATGAKYENWIRHVDRFKGLLSSKVKYYSAFISRPDSAQWIMVREYAELFQKVWAGRNAVILCENGNSMLHVVRKTAKRGTHIRCPSKGAYDFINQFEEHILRLKPDVAILCVGPTATCLANRLSDRIQTIDAGSCGGFLRKLLS